MSRPGWNGCWTPDDDETADTANAMHDAAEFLQEIESMQEDERYRFAADTLEGIHATVEGSGHVTIRQRQAIDSIKDSVEHR